MTDASVGRLASPGKRFGAFLADVVIPFVALLFILTAVGVGGSSGSDAGAATGVLVSSALAVAYIGWALVLFARGTTPGKRALGMRVVREDGRSAGFLVMFLREWIGKAISGMIAGLGYLWILFDGENQGWHDKLLRTYVVDGAHTGGAASPRTAGEGVG